MSKSKARRLPSEWIFETLLFEFLRRLKTDRKSDTLRVSFLKFILSYAHNFKTRLLPATLDGRKFVNGHLSQDISQEAPVQTWNRIIVRSDIKSKVCEIGKNPNHSFSSERASPVPHVSHSADSYDGFQAFSAARTDRDQQHLTTTVSCGCDHYDAYAQNHGRAGCP